MGGLVLGFGIGLVLADMINGGYTLNSTYPSASTFIGIGAIAASVPILMGRRKKLTESVDLYNQNAKSLQQSSLKNHELFIVSNLQGVGIQLKF